MTAGIEQDTNSPELELPPAAVPPLADMRAWARSKLPTLGGDHLNVVLLVCTELVSNAYEHAGSPGRMTVSRAAEPCLVRVEVADGSTEAVTPGRSRLDENRGRGLVLVAGLATDWGVREEPDGKTVWAEIACDAQHIQAC